MELTVLKNEIVLAIFNLCCVFVVELFLRLYQGVLQVSLMVHIKLQFALNLVRH